MVVGTVTAVPTRLARQSTKLHISSIQSKSSVAALLIVMYTSWPDPTSRTAAVLVAVPPARCAGTVAAPAGVVNGGTVVVNVIVCVTWRLFCSTWCGVVFSTRPLPCSLCATYARNDSAADNPAGRSVGCLIEMMANPGPSSALCVSVGCVWHSSMLMHTVYLKGRPAGWGGLSLCVFVCLVHAI